MALEYRLTLAGRTPLEQVGERAFPDVSERPTGDGSVRWTDLLEEYGFNVSVREGRNGFIEVISDAGDWEWEPAEYVSMTFRMDKFADPAWNVVNMLIVVRRVLDSGREDAAFAFNGDVLLLARLDGKLVKHRHQWWSSYPGANEVITG